MKIKQNKKKWTKLGLVIPFLVLSSIILIACSIKTTTFYYNLSNVNSQTIVDAVQANMENEDSSSSTQFKLDKSSNPINCKNSAANGLANVCSNGHQNYKKIVGILWTYNGPTVTAADKIDAVVVSHLHMADPRNLNNPITQSDLKGNFINDYKYDYSDLIGSKFPINKTPYDNPFTDPNHKYTLFMWYIVEGQDGKDYSITATMTPFYTKAPNKTNDLLFSYFHLKYNGITPFN